MALYSHPLHGDAIFVLSQSPCVESTFPNQLCRYGYVTNSKVKFVMVVDSSNTALRDNEIRSVSTRGLWALPGPVCILFFTLFSNAEKSKIGQ